VTFRWEKHVPVNDVKVKDVSSPLFGDYSAGPMQTLATSARWIIREQHLNYEQFQVAPFYEWQPEPPIVHPLYEAAVNIDLGTAEIKQRWATTSDDPILVAAAYNAGSLRVSGDNAWHLASHGDHLDRAAKWYGDACAVLKEVTG
jgi:peptidoglycan LD-endopeptidase CwlK